MRSNYSSALYNCFNNYGLSELLAEVLDLFWYLNMEYILLLFLFIFTDYKHNGDEYFLVSSSHVYFCSDVTLTLQC